MKTKPNNIALDKSQSWQMFNDISPKYDLLNRLLSFGLDVHWRNQLASMIDTNEGIELLDLATGTADVLITCAKHRGNIKNAIGIDMAERMLDVGRLKIRNRGLDNLIHLKNGDATAIPFEDGRFDHVTISFGIRNVKDHNQALREMRRVIKEGGSALILEFSMPKFFLFRWMHICYLRLIVPLVGWLFSGHYKAYRYLNQTIEEFPYGDDFCALMQNAGFNQVKSTPLLFGVATIYEGKR